MTDNRFPFLPPNKQLRNDSLTRIRVANKYRNRTRQLQFKYEIFLRINHSFEATNINRTDTL